MFKDESILTFGPRPCLWFCMNVNRLQLRSSIYTLLAFFLLGPTDVKSESYSLRGFDSRIQEGIDLIYGLHFQSADNHFLEIIESDPANPLGYFFRAMVAWWRVLIDLEDESHDENFYVLLERCIEVCNARLKNDPFDFDSVLFKGGALGFRGRLRGDRGDYLGAARDGLRALPLLNKSREMEVTNKDILFGQGLYNYFADVMPKRHKILRPIMFFLPDGDREMGLEQLRIAAHEGRYAKAEAAYFLAQIYRVFEEDFNSSLPYLESLYRRYSDNALYHRYLARNLVEVGQWERGSRLYSDYIKCVRAGNPGYHVHGEIESHYYLGRLAYFKKNWGSARDHFLALENLLSVPLRKRDLAFASLANLNLGMIADRLSQREEAIGFYTRVLDLPSYSDSHSKAQRFLERPFEY